MTVSIRSADHFCGVFDLSCPIPTSVVDDAHNTKRLVPLNLTIDDDLASSMDGCMRQMEHVLATTPSTQVVRLSITALGSPEWGDHGPAVRDISVQM